MPIRKIDHGSTGIYRRVTTRAEPFEDGTPDAEAMLAVFDEAFKWTIEGIIAGVEKAAASVLSKYTACVEVGGTPGNPIVEQRRSNEPPWVLPNPFPDYVTPHEQESARDAWRAMWEIHSLRRAMELADIQQSTHAAYRLGRLAERMCVRLFEPMAERTIKRDKKRKNAHHEHVVEPAEKQAALFIHELNSILKKQTSGGEKKRITVAVNEAADRLGVSHSSGWNYLRKNRSKVL